MFTPDLSFAYYKKVPYQSHFDILIIPSHTPVEQDVGYKKAGLFIKKTNKKKLRLRSV